MCNYEMIKWHSALFTLFYYYIECGRVDQQPRTTEEGSNALGITKRQGKNN